MNFLFSMQSHTENDKEPVMCYQSLLSSMIFFPALFKVHSFSNEVEILLLHYPE